MRVRQDALSSTGVMFRHCSTAILFFFLFFVRLCRLNWHFRTGVSVLFADSNFVLGNAQAAGWPIVYCSDGFCELTGYGRAQVMARGCACKFLYGPDTEEAETQAIDEALEEKKEHKTELRLYKKNGESRCSVRQTEWNGVRVE